MRTDKILCLTLVFCGFLALAMAYSQSKPRPTPQGATQNQTGAPAADKSGQADTQEHHKIVASRVFKEILSEGHFELVSQVYTPNCIVHEGNKTKTIDESAAEYKGFREAGPDLRMTVERTVVNGDIVTVDWSSQATHTGHGLGIRPTGNKVALRGSSRFRMVNGKIAEVWNNYDRDSLFRQMGVNPKVGRLYDMTQDFIAAVRHFFVNGNS